MKFYQLFAPLISLPTLFAQGPPAEMSPEVSALLNSTIARDSALNLAYFEQEFGNSFSQELFLKEFLTYLEAREEIAKPEEALCPKAATMANKILHRYGGDYCAQEVIASLEAYLQQENFGSWDSHVQHFEQMKKLDEVYAPILQAREQKRERDLLRLNATREGVTVLPNGIQFEIEAGEDSMKELTRGTSETGIRFFYRVTDDMKFEELPECLRQYADRLPKAKSWTFYIPHEAYEALEKEKQKSAADDKKRLEEKMQELTEGTYHPVPYGEPKLAEPERRPLLRLKVWKDDPKNPVKVLPDTQNTI